MVLGAHWRAKETNLLGPFRALARGCEVAASGDGRCRGRSRVVGGCGSAAYRASYLRAPAPYIARLAGTRPSLRHRAQLARMAVEVLADGRLDRVQRDAHTSSARSSGRRRSTASSASTDRPMLRFRDGPYRSSVVHSRHPTGRCLAVKSGQLAHTSSRARSWIIQAKRGACTGPTGLSSSTRRPVNRPQLSRSQVCPLRITQEAWSRPW